MYRQAQALCLKDLRVLRAHRRKACGELLFPTLLGVLCGVALVTAVGWLSEGNKHPWHSTDDETPWKYLNYQNMPSENLDGHTSNV